ncbi:restriction endonuclease subunit S [Bifidobacterium longum]|uniref:restriction endonuclease subunit S n=1 Tax=Bifidobacterium longum TaxID=216816 RepID=UPI001F60542E|nr:restriction endonuclease subunit S [Bifidobacterium longum]
MGELFDYEQPQPYIVRGTEYDDSFPTPVLTAGQSFVLGYTNEKQGIKMASPEHPVIIFDDFTTSSHFVDFPFKVKSSAIKLLTLRDKNEDIHFAYQVLQNIAYTPVSHERHWISKFATFATLMPECKSEMQAIGHFMSNLDGLITLHQRKYDKLVIFKKSMLEKMFPKDGESVPEIRFAGFTDPWEQRKLGELSSEFQSGDFISAEEILGSGPYPVYGGNGLRGYAKQYNHDGFYALIGRQGALCGNVNTAVGKAYFTEHAVAVKANFLHDTRFLAHLLGCMDLGRYSGQSAQPGLAVGVLKEVETTVPSKAEQQAIGSFFSRLDSLITLHQRKLELLQDIKKSLLDKMFV